MDDELMLQSGAVGALNEEQCSPSPVYPIRLVGFLDAAAPISLIDESALSFITLSSHVIQDR